MYNKRFALLCIRRLFCTLARRFLYLQQIIIPFRSSNCIIGKFRMYTQKLVFQIGKALHTGCSFCKSILSVSHNIWYNGFSGLWGISKQAKLSTKGCLMTAKNNFNSFLEGLITFHDICNYWAHDPHSRNFQCYEYTVKSQIVPALE